jgi:predicted dehydrogenase
VRVVYSSISANAQKGASETIQGDEGAMKMTELGSRLYPEYTAQIKWAADARRDTEENAIIITSIGSRLLSNEAQEKSEPLTVDTEKTVDQLQFEAFAHDIRTGGVPRANAMVGLQSAVCAIAGLKAIEEKTEVQIDPAWYQFDFPTDETSSFVV